MTPQKASFRQEMCVGGLFWEMTSGNRDGGLESEKLQQGHIVKLTIASGNLRTVHL